MENKAIKKGNCGKLRFKKITIVLGISRRTYGKAEKVKEIFPN